jgi:hypothetical protein
MKVLVKEKKKCLPCSTDQPWQTKNLNNSCYSWDTSLDYPHHIILRTLEFHYFGVDPLLWDPYKYFLIPGVLLYIGHHIWSVYILLLLVTSAHTLFGHFILMLRLVELYSCIVIMLSSLCTPVRHTLCLAQVAVQLDTTYTHSWCTHCAWISCTDVQLYFSPVSVHSGTVYTTALYNCTLASASQASVL